jgi:heme/copper-type cytochrome/quinol oxidase subunit 2
MIIAVPVVWVVSAVLAYGMLLADFRRRHRSGLSYRQDVGLAALMACVGGPVALVIALAVTGFAEYGLMYRAPRKTS